MEEFVMQVVENVISSLEVAEMVGKEHKNLIRDIRGYVMELGELKIELTGFFRESTYTSDQNKILPCFEVTKKGCEFIAHKLTGIKGTEFTARYINRFHDLEKGVKSKTPPIEQVVHIVKFIADDLKVNEASKLLMYENFCKDYGILTGFLPKYENNWSREMKPATELLKKFGVGLSVIQFNKLLLQAGYLEEKERKSTSSKTGIKKYKALSETGLRYGENLVNPKNQREVQPYYYVDTFIELFDLVTNREILKEGESALFY